MTDALTEYHRARREASRTRDPGLLRRAGLAYLHATGREWDGDRYHLDHDFDILESLVRHARWDDGDRTAASEVWGS